MKERKALFITFEGGEGSGKTTQRDLFYPWFKSVYDDKAIKVREPGGVFLSEKIREILLDPKIKKIGDLTELFLFEAARVEFYSQIIIPSLIEGISVLSDRSFDSTTAYQGYGRGIDLNFIYSLNNRATRGNYPSLTFILDIYYKTGIANRKKDGNVNRIDVESLNFHKKVNAGFRKIAESDHERCVLISYQDGLDKVQIDIRREFSKRYLTS